MDYLKVILAGLTSGTVVGAIGTFVFQAFFSRLLDKRMEIFRQQLQIDTKVRELTLQSQIEFRERQLGEFYGPIYALLRRGEPIYRLWLEERLAEIDDEIRRLCMETNNTIVDIIMKKSHLVVGEKIPRSFTLFLTHVAVWHGYLDKTGGGIPLSQDEFPEAYYPAGFEEEIFETTEQLKRELFELHKRYGLLSHAGA
ncbi:MAG TPA: hypothetical protein DCR74_03160 [Achromobacter sp.]|nr:hypothetical protein [Achromobacter sp.]